MEVRPFHLVIGPGSTAGVVGRGGQGGGPVDIPLPQEDPCPGASSRSGAKGPKSSYDGLGTADGGLPHGPGEMVRRFESLGAGPSTQPGDPAGDGHT